VFVADQRKAAGTAGGGRMKPQWRWFLAGVGVALLLAVLAMIFMAYQMPELLLDWTNLSYCG
jgi:uncharacterized integral membrane protein